MGTGVDRIDDRVDRLERAVESLTRRIQSIEEQRTSAAATDLLAGVPGGIVAVAPRGADVPRVLSLAGRTFVVFAGAYLLRALTESGTLTGPAGITVGLVYAGLWLVLADRTASVEPLGAELHGAAALTIALPLLWEACTTRQLIPPVAAALAVGLVSMAALFVAWRQRLHALAWIATVGALITGVALVVRTTAFPAYAAFFIVLGIATLWLGYDRGWYGLRWPTALIADLAVVGLTTRAITEHTGERPAAAIGAQLLLLSTYLTMIAARTLVRGRAVIPFEVAQGAATLAVGLGGAMVVTAATGVGGLTLGLGAVLLGAGSYVVAFAFVERRHGPGVNFYFYTSVGLLLTLAGTQRILAVPVLGITWGALALLSAWASCRVGRTTLATHAAVFASAAAVSSGLVQGTAAVLLSSPAGWKPFTPSAVVVLVLVAGALLVGWPSSGYSGRVRRIPRLIMAGLLTTGIAGLGTWLLVAAIAGSPARVGQGLPTARTAVLAALAIALAFVGRHERWAELGWLVYPVLIVGATKLLVDDLRHSPASMLVIALALFGGALIAAPRVARPRASSIGPERSPMELKT